MSTVEQPTFAAYEEAVAATAQRRAKLEGRKAEIRGKIATARAERRRLKESIRQVNKRVGAGDDDDADTSAAETRLAEIERLIGDEPRATYDPVARVQVMRQASRGTLGAQLEGVEQAIAATFRGPDGTVTLLERYHDAIGKHARQRSDAAADKLRVVAQAWEDFEIEYGGADRAWRMYWQLGPGERGLRLDLVHTGGSLGGDHQSTVVAFDARVLGGSAWDAVLLELAALETSGGARQRQAGKAWVKPFAAIRQLLGQLRDADCLPASAVTSPMAGEPGVYRRATDGVQVILDEKALRTERHLTVGEGDGFAALRFEAPITEANRTSLEMSRADQARWDRGEPAPQSRTFPSPTDPDPDAVSPVGDDPITSEIEPAEKVIELGPDDFDGAPVDTELRSADPRMQKVIDNWQSQAGKDIIPR